jgi:hypothetical protein
MPTRGVLLTIKHSANRQWAKRRDKHSMSHGPILFAGIHGREQSIVDSMSHLVQATEHGFSEAFFITCFVDQLVGRD